MSASTILRRPFFWVCATLGLLASCISDLADEPGRPGTAQGERREVTIQLDIPAGSSASALPGQSNGGEKIDNLYILAFGAEGENKDMFLYHAEAVAEQNSWKAQLKALEEKQYFILIANAAQPSGGTSQSSHLSQPLEELLASAEGKSKQTLLNDFRLKTEAGPEADNLIIMTGQTASMRITSPNVPLPDAVSTLAATLRRTVAKLSFSVGANVKNFELTSLRLYNVQAEGMVVPLLAEGQTTDSEISRPTLPLKDDELTIEKPEKSQLVYQAANGGSTATKVDAIYFFESGQPDSYPYEGCPGAGYDLYPYRPCLIVGGKWNNQEEKFWRIDFKEKEGTFAHLIRNHSYEITIVDVKGEGANNPDAAGTANIVANIRTWDEDNLGEVTMTGDNSLNLFLGTDWTQMEIPANNYVVEQTYTWSAKYKLQLQCTENGSTTTKHLFTDYPSDFTVTGGSVNAANQLLVDRTDQSGNTSATIRITVNDFSEKLQIRAHLLNPDKENEPILGLISSYTQSASAAPATPGDAVVFAADGTIKKSVTFNYSPSESSVYWFLDMGVSGTASGMYIPAAGNKGRLVVGGEKSAGTGPINLSRNSGGEIITGVLRLVIEAEDGRMIPVEFTVTQEATVQ